MDKVKQLENKLLETLQDFVASWHYNAPNPYHLVIDEQQKRYVLIEMGFQNQVFYHFTLLHVCLEQEKIWIYEDKTEESIAELLLDKGVAPQDIVIGYFSENYRQFTDFAVA